MGVGASIRVIAGKTQEAIRVCTYLYLQGEDDTDRGLITSMHSRILEVES